MWVIFRASLVAAMLVAGPGQTSEIAVQPVAKEYFQHMQCMKDTGFWTHRCEFGGHRAAV